MKQRLFTSLVLLFSIVFQIAPLPVNAQQTAQFDRSRYAIAHKKLVLDNGLTLLVHADN